MPILLVPGLWLDASSWDAVRAPLEASGHPTRAVSLPGMEGRDAERATVRLRDHVAAVVAEVDAAAGPVVLVAHSAGGAVAHAAVDSRPDRVHHVVYVAGFPTPDGQTAADGFDVVDGEIPLPGWSHFGAEELADMDEPALRAFAGRALPSPACYALDRQHLVDERRYDVPVTIVCTDFTAAMLTSWVEAGLAPVAELARIRDVTARDLPTGHWPQLTRPEALADEVRQAVERRGR